MKKLISLGLSTAITSLLFASGCGSNSSPAEPSTTGGTTSGTGGIGGGDGSGGTLGTGGTPSVDTPPIVDPPQGPAEVTITINASEAQPISQEVYGMNVGSMDAEVLAAFATEVGFTVARAGGNRFSAYNWENNASNAGSDWLFHNDGYLSASDVPGAAVNGVLQASQDQLLAALLTLQLGDYVSADKDGTDVRDTADFLDTRFVDNLFEKGSAFSLVPDTTDDAVYQDEFLNWAKTTYPAGKILVALDNEPDLWNHTHETIWPTQPSYDEVVNRNIDSAKMVRKVLPDAEILGLASFGWYGWKTLADSPDYGTKGEFLNYYLDKLAEAEQTEGVRLIDYVDLHWYPEARGDDSRVIEGLTTPGAVEARLQAPRSLWDESFVEESWITESTGEAIQLLPRISAQIAEHYPGTKLAIAEWDYGAGTHISGGIASADVLGIFGRDGVGQASHWHAGADRYFTYGAFQIYRNYDGQGSTFGDTSLSALTSAADETSVYAALDSTDDSRMTIVAINKTNAKKIAEFNIEHEKQLNSAQIYVLDAASVDTFALTARPQGRSSVRAVGPNHFKYEMPPMSVSLLVASTEAEFLPGASWPAPTVLGEQTGSTFASDIEGWTIKADNDVALASSLSWSATEGEPDAGALALEAPFSARDQQVEINPADGTLDLSSSKMSINIKRSGAFDGGVMVVFISGGDTPVWVSHGWSILGGEDWVTIDVTADLLTASDPEFDPSNITSWGVMFNTGGAGAATPTPVTFYVDTAVTQSVN